MAERKAKLKETTKRKAKRVYLSSKDLDLLSGIFFSDICYSPGDSRVPEKEKLISKILRRGSNDL